MVVTALAVLDNGTLVSDMTTENSRGDKVDVLGK